MHNNIIHLLNGLKNFYHIQKEIQNDEHSQISPAWTKYNNQEKGNDVGFPEMKGAGENMYRTQVKFCELEIL
jgi:hypothetical protein